MEKYNLIVIGAGPGGYETALEAAKEYGMKVALVENRQLGGTCLNRGCIPTKTLLHTAEILEQLKSHGPELGLVSAESADYDPAALKSRKEDVTAQLRDGIAGLMKSAKITVYNGTGSLVGKGRVDVRLNDDSAQANSGDTAPSDNDVSTVRNGNLLQLQADNVIIATGSVPSKPPIPGADLTGVFTSDELLDYDRKIDELVVIGGGVIGMEFASIYSTLGAKVTVIEALDRIIANLDKEISRNLSMIAKKSRGIDIHTGAMVTGIEEKDGKLSCKYTEKDEEKEASADIVLISIGRRPCSAGLFANSVANDGSPSSDSGSSDSVSSDGGSSEMASKLLDEKGFIKVNEKYETEIPGIYAIGDVIGGIQLAHVATAEGKLALAAMAGKEPPVDIDTIPSCIYTDPEIASVGITADEAKRDGLTVITKKYPMSANGKSILSLQERGFIKLVADEETHRLLGAQMMCARATDMISQFSQAIVNGLTIEEMAKVIYPHPTFAEGIGEALK